MNTVRVKRPSPLPWLWQVYPTVHTVTARSSRQRLLLLVRCDHCRDIHQHTASLDFGQGKRKAACGLGHYDLLVSVKTAAA